MYKQSHFVGVYLYQDDIWEGAKGFHTNDDGYILIKLNNT